MKKYAKLLIPVTLVLASGVARSQQVDTTAVETELANLPGYMAAIGSGLALGAVAAVSWKWIKGALFG